MKDEKYFNFPISLLQGFLSNKKGVLMDILNYSIYSKSLDYDYGDTDQRFLDAAGYFSINPKTLNQQVGEDLFDNAFQPNVKTGLRVTQLVDYYQNEKSEFDLICLLGFLAIKSVLHKQPCYKLTNLYWLSRMDGKPKKVEECELSRDILKYANRYQLEKIKTELELNWGLKQYGRYTRGFYVSFEMPLEKLVYYAEKKRKSRLKKDLKEDQKNAIKRALQRLQDE